jgi:hypothetical protein
MLKTNKSELKQDAFARNLYEAILGYVQYIGHLFHAVLCKPLDANELMN